jgi:hypothetical protein
MRLGGCFGLAINGQPLGRIVAGDNGHAFFISLRQWLADTIVHCAFSCALQMKFLHCPMRPVSGWTGRGRPLRAGHREFVRRLAGQFLRER